KVSCCARSTWRNPAIRNPAVERSLAARLVSDAKQVMSKLLRFPGTRKITEQASLWLVSIDEGLTDDERRALEEWLADDPRHGQALVRLANVWGAFDALSELA